MRYSGKRVEGLAKAIEGHNPEAGARTLDLLERAPNYDRWIFNRVRTALGQRVLEVGSGTGTITHFLRDRELVVGVDVVDEYVATAQRRFEPWPNVLIKLHDITRTTAGLESFRFDSALAVNALEHIEDDVGAIRAVFSLLPPGGCFVVLSPAHPWLMSPFDREIGHYRRYTKDGLGSRLRTGGFEVVELRRSNPVGALGWFVNQVLFRRRELTAIRVYDRLVPVLAAIDGRFELPFGLSLVAIGRKPLGSVQAAP